MNKGNLPKDYVTFDIIKPGEDQSFQISYGFHPTPFGFCFIGAAPRGICFLSFAKDTDEIKESFLELSKEWPKAELREDSQKAKSLVEEIFSPKKDAPQKHFQLLLKGTPLQINVWRALLQIPPGVIVSYSDIADLVKAPRAVRAVAGQIAKNPISYIIPCHRVIRKSGEIHGYRWGIDCKKSLLAFENNEK